MGVPEALRGLGLVPGEVLLAGGFDPHLFEDPDNIVSFRVRNRLMNHCAAAAGCEHFGLLVGQFGGLHSFGMVGLLVKYSPDVRSALNNLVHYFHLHAHGAVMIPQLLGGTASLGYQIQQSGVEANNHVADGALAIIFNILRELCGPDWKPTEVWSMHKEPENIEPFKKFFGVRLRFYAEQNAILFHSSWLSHRLPDVHSDVRQTVKKQIDMLEAQHRDNFPEQVRTVLRAALLGGDASADRVAALLSIHPRTLNRRLKDYGCGYRELLDESRFEMARQVLNSSQLDIAGIALMLDYADARSFIRAFQRWSGGETPARWRAAQKQARINSSG